MRLLVVLVMLAAAVQVSLQRGFFPGALIGAGIALESAGIGYVIGRASRRHHHRHHGWYGRRRRDLTPEVTTAEPPSEKEAEEERRLEEAQLEAYFRLVAAEDLVGCGLRLVCELAAAEDRSGLLDDQRVILALFGTDGPQSTSQTSPKLAYDAAHNLGQASRSAAACAKAFASCPAGADEMMATLRTVRQASRQTPSYP